MKHEIVEKIKSIKFSRLKPEEVYIIKILNNLEIYKFKILPFCMVFKYNGIIMFEYNISNKFFRCNKIYIFDLIKDKYNLTYIDTIDLIKKIVKNHLINDNITIINDLKIFISDTNKYGLQEKDLIKINLADHYMNDIDEINLIKTELNIMTLDNYISMCKKNLKHETN